MKKFWQQSALSFALVSTFGASSSLAAYETLTSGALQEVMEECNPDNLPGVSECKVNGIPGLSGYSLIAARVSTIVKNDITVGALFDSVWRKGSGANADYIFGAKVLVNTEQWDASGLAFNINDIMRRTLPNKAVAVGYYDGLPSVPKKLLAAGRTCQGLNELEEGEDDPDRDNSWVDLRVDVNAADPDGVSSPLSPWLFVKTKAPQGIELAPFAFRILNSDYEDPSEAVDLFTAGYQPVGTPDTGCGGEEEEE